MACPFTPCAGIDLTIERGEFAALVGPSGVGEDDFAQYHLRAGYTNRWKGMAQWQTFVAHER